MDHAQIAAEALRYRLTMLGLDETSPRSFDAFGAATRAVTCADYEIDGALRCVASAWTKAGLGAEALSKPWAGPLVDALFSDNPHLVDALDSIVQRVALQPS